MNKLTFISIFIVAILYIQCDDTCTNYATKDSDGNDITINEEFCKKLPVTESNKDKKQCAYDSTEKKCKEVDKATTTTTTTNSADIMSLYKISLALFIIFAIL